MSAESVEFYKDKAGEWRWRAVAGNQEIVGTSGEGYKNEQDAVTEARQLFGSGVYYRMEDGTEVPAEAE